MMVGGTALQMQAAKEQRDDRRRILNQQLDRDESATKKAIDLVQQEAGNYTAQNRADAMAEQEGQTYQQIQQDMQGAGGANVATASDAGNVSDDFLKTKAARAVDEGTRLTAVAREAAKNRAPTMLMSNDSLRRAGMVGNLNNIWGTNKNMGTAAGVDASGVEAPAYGGLGAIASSIGGASLYGNPSGTNAALTKYKYSGSSANPYAANYVNSFDGGIQF